MTSKQKRFVEEYLIDLCATQAAIRAGYSPETAGSIGSENLHKPEIRARIDAAMAELSRRTGVNQERIVRELAKVAFGSNLAFSKFTTSAALTNASADDTAAIASVKVKQIPTDAGMGIEREIRMADKLKALELLGKHLGMFTDNVHLTGDMGVQIVDDIPNSGTG